MLKVMNYEVYGMERAVMASGLPMAVDSSSVVASEKRAKVLGSAKAGSGHDCFLKGIVVEARVKYPLYWTKQFQRYHFADIVSSQSTMHRVTKFNIDEQCNEWVSKTVKDELKNMVIAYNRIVLEKITDAVWIANDDWSKPALTCEEFYHYGFDKQPHKLYNESDIFMAIISNLPSGFEMEMEIVTNYLQLKTIYDQRRYHKLPDWRVFCDWIESLPNFKEFTTKEVK